MAVTKFEGTEAVSRENFNRRIDEMNTALNSAEEAFLNHLKTAPVIVYHNKYGYVHELYSDNGLPNADIVTIKFKATADFEEGDLFTIDGYEFAAQNQLCEAVSDIFKTGAVITAELDLIEQTINFKQGGGAKLNVFTQLQPPTKPNGIWIETDVKHTSVECASELSQMGDWVNYDPLLTAPPTDFTIDIPPIETSDKIYFFDRRDLWIYDKQTDSYIKKANFMPSSRYVKMAIKTSATKILLLASTSASGSSSARVHYLFEFDAEAETLSDLGTTATLIIYGGEFINAGSKVVQFYQVLVSSVSKFRAIEFDMSTFVQSQIFEQNTGSGEDTTILSFKRVLGSKIYFATYYDDNIASDIYTMRANKNLRCYDYATNSIITEMPNVFNLYVNTSGGYTMGQKIIMRLVFLNSRYCLTYDYCDQGKPGSTGVWVGRDMRRLVDLQEKTFIDITSTAPPYDPAKAVHCDNEVRFLEAEKTPYAIKTESKVFDDKTAVIKIQESGMGVYRTNIVTDKKGNVPLFFDDAFLYAENSLQSLPAYYGNGEEWIKIKD